MKLTDYFKDFLNRSVNLNKSRIALLDERTTTITGVIKSSSVFRDHFIDVIPQGSYAHKTIIKPVRENDEFDADVLLFIEEIDGWSACDYVEKLYWIFRDHPTYKNMVSRKTRCATLTYANDFHIDIVPYMERHGGKYITNRHQDNFEKTDPEKFTEWLDERNRITKHHFVKVIRLLKYLRDFKRTFSVKSIILSTLVGEQVNDAALLEDSGCYDDIPTTLLTLTGKLKEYVQEHELIPTILDPGETGENFSDRWDQGGWTNFRNRIISYADKINAAYYEPDKERSLRLWQEIFGDDFKRDILVNERSMSAASNTDVAVYNRTEEQIWSLGYPLRINPSYKVRMIGKVAQKPGFRSYDLNSRGNKVTKGRNINFRLEKCTVPLPYTVFWKTLNRGDEAITRNCIRGQIHEGSSTHSESTDFRGNHYVECYVVKDGYCVARDRQSVIII